MNSMNQLEHRMGSWTPREPSASLKSRLFPNASATAAPRLASETGPDAEGWLLGWQPALNWLASAVGCFLLLGVAWGVRESTTGEEHGSANARFFASVALSNREMVAYCTAPDHSQRNVWGRPILGWTNTTGSPSSIG